MNRILIGTLLLLVLLLLYYIAHFHKKLRDLVEAVNQLNQGKYQKIFVRGNSPLSKLALELNDVESIHQEDIRRINKIEQANKELFTSLSHDVRTPLTSLMGYLEALDAGVVSGEERIHYIQIARQKSYDLKLLVDTLFDWFKINSNEMKLQSEVIDICEVTRQIIIEWAPILEKTGIHCIISIPEEEYSVYIDQAAYTRIANNLIQNILVHSECKNMKISVALKTDKIEITFWDDGAGMTKEQLEHIFERLYKADRSRNRKSSGLGLCIAKQLTEMMNGSIEAKSLPREATSFIIRFPMIK
jgi:signal transduction histidine kinase